MGRRGGDPGRRPRVSREPRDVRRRAGPSTLHPGRARSAPAISVEPASSLVMRYRLALPEGWSSGRTWAVVVVIPDAAREFRANLETFVAARGHRPFILVAPEVHRRFRLSRPAPS